VKPCRSGSQHENGSPNGVVSAVAGAGNAEGSWSLEIAKRTLLRLIIIQPRFLVPAELVWRQFAAKIRMQERAASRVFQQRLAHRVSEALRNLLYSMAGARRKTTEIKDGLLPERRGAKKRRRYLLTADLCAGRGRDRSNEPNGRSHHCVFHTAR
jgi:hypothetical protein